jgi:hypothetical protein
VPDTEILQTGVVTGIVSDEFDQPLADYTIELYVNGKMLDQVRTNESGQYEIEAPIAPGQDARLFAHAPNYRESLRRLAFDLVDKATINFPVIENTDFTIPGIAPGDQNLIVVNGFFKDSNGNPARGYVNIHDRNDQTSTFTVDMLSRPDEKGYYELFVPRDKIFNLEMVERCDEGGIERKMQVGPYIKEINSLADFISNHEYDRDKTYQVVGNFTNCNGGSLDQFHFVTYTLNDVAVDAPLPSSHLFYYECNTPISNGDKFNYFIRDRENRKRSEVIEIAANNYLIDYGNIEVCNDDPKSVTVIFDGKKIHFEGEKIKLVDIPSQLSIEVDDPDGEIVRFNMFIDPVNQLITSMTAVDKDNQVIIDYKDSQETLTFDLFDFSKNNGFPFFEAGIHHKGINNVSVSIHTW